MNRKGKKNKIKPDYFFKDIYKWFKKNILPEECPYDISYATWCSINEELNEMFIERVLSGSVERLPCRLGLLKIIKYKPKLKLNSDGEVDSRKIPVDYKKTIEYWREVYPGKTIEEIKEIEDRIYIYHDNKHSRGYIAEFYWDRRSSNLPNKSAYDFIPFRKYNRKIAAIMKDPTSKIDYYMK